MKEFCNDCYAPLGTGSCDECEIAALTAERDRLRETLRRYEAAVAEVLVNKDASEDKLHDAIDRLAEIKNGQEGATNA